MRIKSPWIRSCAILQRIRGFFCFFVAKENHFQGDSFQLLLKDFEFIKIDMSEKEKSEMSKVVTKIVKDLINKALFKFFRNIKQTHSKLDGVQYSRLET